jgi:GH24 family phage-related lysozyme (muramidase)
MLSLLPALLLAVITPTGGQPALSLESLTSPAAPLYRQGLVLPGNGALALLDFRDSDIKFSLPRLMETLRDHQHEGWVLAAYPDPNTHRPLIGAGFSLDVPETPHPQLDPFNPHPFVEPSSAQLWEAAGLPPAQLTQILNQFARDNARWTARQWRRKIVHHTLAPQISEEDANRLLRISAIQAIYNSKAYCRRFDALTASQQMALSQLVFQMGTNLQGFVTFLNTLNDEDNALQLARLDGYPLTQEQRWRSIQYALIDSQWARRYATRAALVIAMFDPEYSQAPGTAQQRIEAALRPPVDSVSVPGEKPAIRLAGYTKHHARSQGKKTARPRRRITPVKRA